MNPPALRVSGLCVSYGAIEAVKGIDLEVRSGELVALIGANGAGKTSCLKAITGLLPWGGSIELFEQPVRGVPAHQLLLRGLALVPEGRGMFARMTVEENLQMGAFTRGDAQVAHDLEQMYQSFPRLKERSRQLAGTLSGGEQQMLALARALTLNPRLLLLDEPMEGLAPIIVKEMMAVIRQVVADGGMTVILVEQHAKLALSLTSQAIVLERGRIAHRSDSASLLRDADALNRLVALA